MIHKFHVLHIVRNIVSCFSNIILTVDLFHTTPGIFPDTDRSENRGPVLFRTHMEKLPLHSSDDLEILDQIVTLVLSAKLRLLPALRDVIHFS